MLRRSLLIWTVVTVVTAWFSVTFYFPDEHFQVLEFMGHEAGRHACFRPALGV